MIFKWPKRIKREGIDNYGRDELINAVIDQDYKKVKNLINKGANINIKDDNLWTSLHFASQEGNDKILIYLLNESPLVNEKNNHGNTPLFIFIGRSNYFNNIGNILKLFKDNGANINEKNNYGVSILNLIDKIYDPKLKEEFSKIFKI